MNELQRMQYLDELGIDTFVPRCILPNAPQAQQCVLPVEQVARVTQAANEASTSLVSQMQDAAKPTQNHSGAESASSKASESGVSELTEAISSLKPEVKSKKLKHAAASLQALLADLDAPKQVARVRFSLGLWTVQPGLQIVDSHTGAEALPTARLLANILQANGLLPVNLPKMEVQKWPLPGVPEDHQDWQAAREMLGDFMFARHESCPLKLYLLFGEEACKVFVEQDEYQSLLYQHVQLDTFDVPALVLPSLKFLLENPSEKAKLWQVLQSAKTLLS